MGKVRIIGGIHRSRILRFKDELAIRPTPDRVRETLFNWLGQDLTGKTCLDLFAGSGALGFEALSRNAKQVIMVEKNPAVLKDLRLNQELLGVTNLEVSGRHALNYLEQCSQSFNVIFLDPPYTSDLLTNSLKLISNGAQLKAGGVLYIEYQTPPSIEGYTVLKQGLAGNVHFALIASK